MLIPLALSASGREQTVPGAVAVQTARLSGWTVTARNSVIGGGGHCELQGAMVTAHPGALCWVDWFVPPRDDCRQLRDGWRLQALLLRDQAGVQRRHAALPTQPTLSLRLDARERDTPLSLTLESIVLSGPAGQPRFEQAFNHCRPGG